MCSKIQYILIPSNTDILNTGHTKQPATFDSHHVIAAARAWGWET